MSKLSTYLFLLGIIIGNSSIYAKESKSNSNRTFSCTPSEGLLNGFVAGQTLLECSNQKKETYNIDISSKGLLSLRIFVGGYFKMSCSSSNPSGVYYGAKIGIFSVWGSDFMLMAGKKGVCTIGGINKGLQLGVDLSSLKMTVWKD